MVVTPGEDRDLEWEAVQIDRSLDFANLMYGALLGGYIGVLFGAENPSVPAMANLLFILFNLTIIVMNFRSLAHHIAGTIDGPLLWPTVAIVGGTVGATATVTLTKFDLTLFGLLVAGWLGTSVVCVAGNVMKRWV